MLLTQQSIIDHKLVVSGNKLRLENATCDLTVGSIFATGPDGGEVFSNDYKLLPGQTVIVISEQTFNMPDNVTGLATLVTELTRQGLLCLNAGIIDPGYSGPISATLVNFSSEAKKISVGTRLFRVLFFQHERIAPISDKSMDLLRYRRDTEYNAKANFASDFLDVRQAMTRYWGGLAKVSAKTFFVYFLPIFLAALAFFTFLRDFKIV